MATVYAISGGTGCTDPSNAFNAPNQVFTGDTGNTNWSATWTMGAPTGALSTTANAQSITIRCAKDSTTGNTPSITQIRVLDNGTQIAVDATGWDITSDKPNGQDVTINWTATGSENLSTLQVEIATSGAGGPPSSRRSVQIDAIALDYTLAPIPTGPVAKVWNGSFWDTGVVKVWNGLSWDVGSVTVY